MTTDLQDFVNLSNAALWHGFVIFLRVGAIVSLLPAFGEQTLPVRVKLAAAIAFTLIVAPIVPAVDPVPTVDSFFWLTMTETLSGFFLGIGVRILIFALQTAGSMAAQSTSLSQILGSASADPMPAMGQILIVAALALAMTGGLHIKAAAFIIYSYDLFPAGSLISAALIAKLGVAHVAKAFSFAFTLAAPFVIISVIYNLALGVINKAMPQLMVAFVGAPVITAGGLMLLLVASPVMLELWAEALTLFLAKPYGAPQ